MMDFWEANAADGTELSGMRGSSVHVHEYGFGIGQITDQQTGKPITTFNRFNQEVDKLLPDWMKE